MLSLKAQVCDEEEPVRIVNQASSLELLSGVWKHYVLSCFYIKCKPATTFLLAGDEEGSKHQGKEIWRPASDLLRLLRRNPLLHGLLPQWSDTLRFPHLSGVPGIWDGGGRDLGVVMGTVDYLTSMTASMASGLLCSCLYLGRAGGGWRLAKTMSFSFCSSGYKMPSTGFNIQEKLSKGLWGE